jgi:hypothetical protein
VGGDDLLDNLFSDNGADGLVIYIRGRLGGDEDVVNANNSELTIGFLLVFEDNLGLAVGTQPWDSPGVSLVGKLFRQFVGEPMGVRVQALFVPLVGSVTEHETLITSSWVFFGISFTTLLSND